MDFVPFKQKRTFNDFSSQIPSDKKKLFGLVRDFCLSLGNKVVEDVRMHRIVFGKSITFRWFADIEPSNSELIIKIRENRKVPLKIHKIYSIEDFNLIKEEIRKAFEKIS